MSTTVAPWRLTRPYPSVTADSPGRCVLPGQQTANQCPAKVPPRTMYRACHSSLNRSAVGGGRIFRCGRAPQATTSIRRRRWRTAKVAPDPDAFTPDNRLGVSQLPWSPAGELEGTFTPGPATAEL